MTEQTGHMPDELDWPGWDTILHAFIVRRGAVIIRMGFGRSCTVSPQPSSSPRLPHSQRRAPVPGIALISRYPSAFVGQVSYHGRSQIISNRLQSILQRPVAVNDSCFEINGQHVAHLVV